MSEPRTSSPEGLIRADLFLLVAAALIVVGFRLHAYPAPLESDECNYAYFAQHMLAGDRLYVDLWDHQPPGIFTLLMLPTAVFGSSPVVYRTLALVLVLLTMLGVFDIARRWFNRPAAWTATLLFAVASSDPGIAGEGCNREIYMNVLLVGAWWMLVSFSVTRFGGGLGLARTRRISAGGDAGRYSGMRRVFIAGLLIGLASTIKTVVAMHWLALLPVVVMMPTPNGAGRRRHVLGTVAAFGAGPAVLWLAIFVYFAADGRVAALVDAVFIQNLIYSGGGEGRLTRLAAFFNNETVFRTAPALWLAGGFGLIAFPWRQGRIRSVMVAGLTIGSYLAVCLPGKFWPHYYMLMLPPVVLLAAGLVHRVALYRRGLSVVVGVVVLLALLSTEIPGYLLVEPDHIAWDRYGPRMSWVRDQARRIASVTDPGDTIYTWSSDAGLYYYSDRRCATRFTMNGTLLDKGKTAHARRLLLLEDLVRNKPRLIVLCTPKPPFRALHQFFLDHKYISVVRTERMELLCDLERPIAQIDWTWRMEN